MKSTVMRTALRSFVVLAAVSLAGPTFAANYPLELASPRAVGTAPTANNRAMTSTNRIFKAYPGIEYNIRAVVVGGAYPYNFTLANAPAGMTINARTGEIRWPSPAGTTVTPTITVRDSEGTQRSAPWTITVTTQGFRFVDATNGRAHPTGTGTLSNPYRNIRDLVDGDAPFGDIVYFRNGTYDVITMPRVNPGGPWERVEFPNDAPNIWIAYPGDSPRLDFGFRPGVDNGVLIRLRGENVYVDGFETTNTRVIGFQVHSGQYGVFRRLRMHDLNTIGADLEGTNASFILTMSSYTDSDVGGNPSSWGHYLAIQNNEFYNATSNMALKFYSQWKMVVEDNLFRDLYFGAEFKSDLAQFVCRNNRFIGIPGRSIGGNMHSLTTSGEILFNYVNSPSGQHALDVNQDSHAKRVDVYRNTFVGRVRMRNVDSLDGPFRFYENVFVNSTGGDGIERENISDASRVVVTNNLVGTASTNIVDASGSLTAAYSQYLGSRGHTLGTEVRPFPPTAVNVQ